MNIFGVFPSAAPKSHSICRRFLAFCSQFPNLHCRSRKKERGPLDATKDLGFFPSEVPKSHSILSHFSAFFIPKLPLCTVDKERKREDHSMPSLSLGFFPQVQPQNLTPFIAAVRLFCSQFPTLQFLIPNSTHSKPLMYLKIFPSQARKSHSILGVDYCDFSSPNPDEHIDKKERKKERGPLHAISISWIVFPVQPKISFLLLVPFGFFIPLGFF